MRTTAVVFAAVNQATVAEIELPDPQPTDVVVETQVSGVSVGTERWALIGKRPEMSYPHVPGYMGIGIVRAVGAAAAARGWKPGMGINFNHSRLPKPHAANSWMGAHLAEAVVDVCSGADEVAGAHNFFAAAPVPEGLDPLAASLTQLAAVAMRGIEMATIRAGSSVLVVGAGVIGQFAAQIVRLKGARVMVADLQAERLAIAARCGAEWTVDSGREDLHQRARAAAPDGFDTIIDTASIPAVVNGVIPLLRTWGTLVFQGWYPPPSALDLNAMHGRLPTCVFPCGHTATHVATAMRWARDGRLDSRALLTRVLRPAEAPAFYAHMAGSSDAFLGAAIDWRKA
ncbi:MAG: zinc-binding dehydrogenase [Planctomycetes bacterium]|nr:zinc-binding dehydrogenase [Planctomycetota bacterium]